MRAKHTRFNRVATTVVAGLGLLAGISAGTVLALQNSGAIEMHNDDAHIYEGKYYVDGSLVYQTKKAKGELIGYDAIPAKDKDVDGQPYVFVGWDTTGEGIPDIPPIRMYYNFSADAVFAKFGIPDIDWTKVDFNKLLDILNALDIDLESFMNFFGLTWEDMLDLLNIPVIRYTTDYTGIVYLRNESFGDYNSFKHKWENASYYPLDNISSGSVNPLQYAMDKAGKTLGDKGNATFALEYLKDGSNYPVVAYEKSNQQGLPSDSISLTNPSDKKYTSSGLPYSFMTSQMINVLRSLPFSNDAIKSDEAKYQEYVKEHYLGISNDYKNTILNLLESEGITYDDNYKFVDKLYSFFKNNYEFNFMMPSYPMTSDPAMYFLTDAKVGLGRHFGASTTLIMRALGVPARYVQGYVDFSQGGTKEVSAIQAHSWCEIYVNGVGWLAIDTSLQSISALDLSFLFNTDDIDDLDFENPPEGTLEKIEATIPQTVYKPGDEIDLDSIEITAFYDSGDTRKIDPSKVKIVPPDMKKPGEKEILILYHEGDEIAYASIPISVETDIISGKIVLKKTPAGEDPELVKDYNGKAQFSDDMFEILDGDEVMELREGDTLVITPIFNPKQSQYTALSQIVDAGSYLVKMEAHIYDNDGNDVTTTVYNISNSGKEKFRFEINPIEVVLNTGSKTINSDELTEEDYPDGKFTYKCLVNSEGEEITDKYRLTSDDYIEVSEITGWTVLTEPGSERNIFDVDSVHVYRDVGPDDRVEVTRNYSFTLVEDEDELGTITIVKVGV